MQRAATGNQKMTTKNVLVTPLEAVREMDAADFAAVSEVIASQMAEPRAPASGTKQADA